MSLETKALILTTVSVVGIILVVRFIQWLSKAESLEPVFATCYAGAAVAYCLDFVEMAGFVVESLEQGLAVTVRYADGTTRVFDSGNTGIHPEAAFSRGAESFGRAALDF